jgi:hypothetical protein
VAKCEMCDSKSDPEWRLPVYSCHCDQCGSGHMVCRYCAEKGYRSGLLSFDGPQALFKLPTFWWDHISNREAVMKNCPTLEIKIGWAVA